MGASNVKKKDKLKKNNKKRCLEIKNTSEMRIKEREKRVKKKNVPETIEEIRV